MEELRREHWEEEKQAERELREIELRRLRKMHTIEEAQCLMRVLEEEPERV